jgi:glucose-6-phosphate dehydrogenase assembly protein OpcA
VNAIEQLAHAPIAANPAEIEAEFDRIWAETAGAGFDESSVRLRVLNLVLVGEGAESQRAFEQVMGELPERHPCRGMLTLIDIAATEVEATIGAHCRRSPSGTRHLCSEEILLRGAPEHAAQLSSAALALLVPDVPVMIWIAGRADFEGRVTERLLDVADQLIVDSAQTPGGLPAFDAAERAGEEHDVAIIDLAWVRLAPWRELLAQLFDGSAGAELDQVQSIEIAGRPDVAEPLLLAGWLVSRLQLTPADRAQGGNDFRATLYDGTRGVRLSIRPEGSDSLRAVRITTPGGVRSITLHAESGHLHVEAPEPGDEGGESGDRHGRVVVEAPPGDDASLIEAALSGSDGHTLYREAVAAARSLVGG